MAEDLPAVQFEEPGPWEAYGVADTAEVGAENVVDIPKGIAG